MNFWPSLQLDDKDRVLFGTKPSPRKIGWAMTNYTAVVYAVIFFMLGVLVTLIGLTVTWAFW